MRLYSADERRLNSTSGLLVLLPTLILLHFRHWETLILRIAPIALRTANNRAAFSYHSAHLTQIKLAILDTASRHVHHLVALDRASQS